MWCVLMWCNELYYHAYDEMSWRGSVREYVLYFKCHRIYYSGSVTEYTNLLIYVTLAYNGISILKYLKTPDLECIFYDTWSWSIMSDTSPDVMWCDVM